MFNIMTMVFSMITLITKLKTAGWCSLLCALIGYGATADSQESIQSTSSTMLAVSSLFMAYMHNGGTMAQEMMGQIPGNPQK